MGDIPPVLSCVLLLLKMMLARVTTTTGLLQVATPLPPTPSTPLVLVHRTLADKADKTIARYCPTRPALIVPHTSQ